MSMATSPRSLKERQRSEREQLILNAAEGLLVEKGYSAMSVDEIASHVGISKGTVYLHFPSKEDLLLALIVREFTTYSNHIDAIFASPQMPLEKLAAIIALSYGNMGSTHITLFATIAQNPELRALLMQKKEAANGHREKMSQQISEIIDEGKACGQITTALPTSVIIGLFFSLLTPHAFAHLVEQDTIPFADLQAYVTQFFFKGVAVETPPERGSHGDNTTGR